MHEYAAPRGEEEVRDCNHCGMEYVDVYDSDETHHSYCQSCLQKYEQFTRIAQVMKIPDERIEQLQTIEEETPYVFWVNIHPNRAFLFDPSEVDWDVEKFADVENQLG